MAQEPTDISVELQAVHLASSAIIRAGFEIARPERDTGFDLLMWRATGTPLRAYPVQVKGFTGRSLKFDRKYRTRPDMIHLHVLEVASENPQVVGWLYPMWWRFLQDTGTAAGGTALSWADPDKATSKLGWWTATMNAAQEEAVLHRSIHGQFGIGQLAEWADELAKLTPCTDCGEPRVPSYAGPRPPDGTVEAGVAVVGTCVVDGSSEVDGGACLNVTCARYHAR